MRCSRSRACSSAQRRSTGGKVAEGRAGIADKIADPDADIEAAVTDAMDRAEQLAVVWDVCRRYLVPRQADILCLYYTVKELGQTVERSVLESKIDFSTRSDEELERFARGGGAKIDVVPPPMLPSGAASSE